MSVPLSLQHLKKKKKAFVARRRRRFSLEGCEHKHGYKRDGKSNALYCCIGELLHMRHDLETETLRRRRIRNRPLVTYEILSTGGAISVNSDQFQEGKVVVSDLSELVKKGRGAHRPPSRERIRYVM